MDAGRWPLFFLCFGLTVIQADSSSWTAEVPSSVAGLIGSCVVIPCSFKYPEPEKEVTTFTGIWTEETSHVIYHPDVTKVMHQYQRRTELIGDPSKKNCSLKIDPLKQSDTETFHFRIEMEGYEKYSYKENKVSITASPSPKPITIEMKEEVELGGLVSASCSALHSCPTNPPVLIWSHPGKLHVESKGHSNGQWEVTSWLSFHPTRTDHNKSLECTATYHGGQRLNSSKVLRVKYAPVSVKVAHKSSVSEGDTVQLRCSSDAYPPAHSYQWHSDNSGDTLSRGHLYTLTNVSRHTGALYCTAINTEGRANSSLVQLNVLYPPEIKAGSTCSSDKDMTTCVCIANSKPSSIVEFLLAEKVLPSTKVERHGSVTIGTLQGDLGSSELIHCRAHNSQGNATLTLTVPTDGKVPTLYIAIGVGAIGFMVLVILLTVLGLSKKCRRSPDNNTTLSVQELRAPKTLEPPMHSSKPRKEMKNTEKATFSNEYTNEIIYGNMEAEWAAGDDAVYANM